MNEMSFEDVLRNEIAHGTNLEQAVREIRAKLAREEAERVAKEAAAAKAKMEAERAANAKRETTAKQITDIANRAINGETTAEDVAVLLSIYLTKENVPADLVKDMATADTIEAIVSICNIGTAVMAALEGVTKDTSKEKECVCKATKPVMNDPDKIIRSFLNSL